MLPIETEGDPETKICIYCKLPKPISEFPKHYIYADGLDSRCRVCKDSRKKFLDEVKKYATPKPELCEMDNCTNPAYACDHDPNITDPSKAFRGWLCDKHNKTLGVLGDSFDKLTDEYAAYVVYLRRAKTRE